MITCSIAFLLALIVVLVATPLVRYVALRLGVVDSVGKTSRKIHARPIPRLGGVAVVLAFLTPLGGLLLTDTEVGRIFASNHDQVLGLFLGSVAILLLGVCDDVHGTKASHKLLVQFGVAAALYGLGFHIDRISIPFGLAFELGYASFPLTVLWIVGMINAMNLIDGLDGLAAGVALMASLATLVVALISHNVLMLLFMATLGGALLGFLYYNFNPARIFLGDTGSMFLGFVVAVTTVQTNTKGAATVAMVTPMLALGIPIVDTLLAMVRRSVRGRPMFRADREHIHHRLVALGLTHRNAVLVIYATSFALCVCALAASFDDRLVQGLGLAISAAIVTAFMVRLGYWDFGSLPQIAHEISETRRSNALLRDIVRHARRQLRAVNSIDDAWLCLLQAARRLEVAGLVLRIDGASPPRCVWEEEIELAAQDTGERATLHEALGDTHHGSAALEFMWRNRDHVNVDTEAAVKTLGAEFVHALKKLPTLAVRRGVVIFQ